MNVTGFRPGSRHEALAEALIGADMDVDNAMLDLAGKIGYEDALTFWDRTSLPFTPLTLGRMSDSYTGNTQFGRTRKTLLAIRRVMHSIQQKETP